MPWSWSCFIRVDVYGRWWLWVTEAQEITLETSLTKEVRTEVSLPSFSSDFPCLNLIFLCCCPPPQRMVSFAPDTAYLEGFFFCFASHPPHVYGSISHLFAVPCAYFVLSLATCVTWMPTSCSYTYLCFPLWWSRCSHTVWLCRHKIPTYHY